MSRVEDYLSQLFHIFTCSACLQNKKVQRARTFGWACSSGSDRPRSNHPECRWTSSSDVWSLMSPSTSRGEPHNNYEAVPLLMPHPQVPSFLAAVPNNCPQPPQFLEG